MPRNLIFFLGTTVALLHAQTEQPSRHFFRPGGGALTEPDPASPREVGVKFLAAQAAGLQLDSTALNGARLIKEYRTAHNGVTHLVYRQRFGELEVANGEWTINVDREGRVINAGGLLFPAPAAGTLPPGVAQLGGAARAAVEAVNPELAKRFRARVLAPETRTEAVTGRSLTTQRLAAVELGADVEARAVWYGAGSGLLPAWDFYVVDEDRVSAYSVIVDSVTQKVIEKQPLTWFQNPVAPKGLVFERQGPQPNPRPGFRNMTQPEYAQRTLQALTGDATASPRGWVEGDETAGNNVISGVNTLGVFFAPAGTARSASKDFQFPLELGPGSNPNRFADAATVNLFYWMNRSHDLFYEAGFNEAAGNYQADNFNRGGLGGDPISTYTHFGSAGAFSASLNNAFYTTRRGGEDGSPSMIAMFLGTGAGVISDGAYDSEVMVHEYTHGVSTRLVRRLSGHHGGAMGEAWSDFFSLEFTVPEGAPPDGVYSVGEYLFQSFGPGLRSRPYSTNMEENPITFADMGRVSQLPMIHQDGGIWVQALWEMRANLIRQFGEREGRRRLRLMVIDGMKLSPPAPTMVDMRDAILLADRVGFSGASQQQIWQAFARRGLGALAHAASTDSTHVAASFDMPTNLATMRFYEPSHVNGEALRIVLQDANNDQPTVNIQLTSSSGDLENLILQKQGSVYFGTIATTTAPVTKLSGGLTSTVGDLLTAYYMDPNSGGIAARQIEITTTTRPAYTIATRAPSPFTFAGETPLNFRAGLFGFRRFDLPFEFPFFGKKYGSLRVFSNGLLAFDLPPSTGCTDGPTLARFNGIAPLWMLSNTLGNGQPGEDVYVSRPAPDAITFRWAASTDTIFARPEPMNFAATLWEDGRIEFQYGGGNKNLSTDAPIFGCPTSTPTVGISNGNETFTQLAFNYLGRANLENVAPVQFLPGEGFSSIPEVTIARPDAGQSFQGVLNGRAIITDAETFVTRADVYVDGVFRAIAIRQGGRPPECAAVRATDCAEFQFNLSLDGLAIAPGRHNLKLRAVNWRGGFRDGPATPVEFNVEPGQALAPKAVIEQPAMGATVSGLIRVRGYAYAERLRVTAVEVLVDGLTVVRGPLVPRPEICATLSPVPPNCPAIGFDLPVNTAGAFPPIQDGKRLLQVRVIDESGRMTLLPETPLEINVNNGANQPPVGVLVTPANNQRISGMTNIWGYAWDPDGRIVQAQLLVNGEVRAVIPYGEPRPGECPALPAVTACPNIGFALDFDTRKLLNGQQVLGVRVIDNRGAATVLPSPGPNVGGVTVFVEN